MHDAAARLHHLGTLDLPPLAVTFADRDRPPVPGDPIVNGERNLHGRPRLTCQLCGECDVGCNYGSKNTLDFNYLSRAKELGAEIRTLCEVRTFEPRGGTQGGYVVRYAQHDLEREGKSFATSTIPLIELTADRLILSAGTFGSTYLLLKNRKSFPALSTTLGSRFCGNGDLLTFAIDCARGDMDSSYGPVITSAFRVADTLDGTGANGRGFYIEDAGVPSFMTWMVEATDVGGQLKRGARFGWQRLLHALHLRRGSHLSGEMSALLGPGMRSARALPLLGMGRDIPNGRMSLDDDGGLSNDWSTKASKEYFMRVRAVMKEMADVWGAGRFQDNPLWYLNRVVTVHPLGGCPMGTGPEQGVVDPYGEVFGHEGLFVADGSVLPGPVGANPSLTIAALADRFADRIVERATRSRPAAVAVGKDAQ